MCIPLASLSFWTSSVPSATSTSNPPLFLAPFGLPPCLPLLQRPIHRSFSLLLDFLRAFLCSNVQSTFPTFQFWTFSLSHSALTSNPRFRLPGFGLLPCLPLLQRPIHRSFSLLLDFLRAFHYFNVQSAALSRSFWTSSVTHSALTSNSRFRLSR